MSNCAITPLHHARVTLPSGKSVAVERIGKGRYTTAWANGHNVYLQTHEKDASKDILSGLRGSHIPRCRYIGTLDGPYRLYAMPKYRKVSARETPEAWKHLKELIRLREEAQSLARKRRGFLFDGYDLNDCFLEIIEEREHILPRSLVSALTKIIDAAGNYGEYTIELRKANVAADAAGRLILLDPVYDLAEVREDREARLKRHRGY